MYTWGSFFYFYYRIRFLLALYFHIVYDSATGEKAPLNCVNHDYA
jgi:hypothetical protein